MSGATETIDCTEPAPRGTTHNGRHAVLSTGSQRIIVIGDVHGCAEELDSLLDKCGHDPELDLVILVGDLVNKGPMSARVRALTIQCTTGVKQQSYPV